MTRSRFEIEDMGGRARLIKKNDEDVQPGEGLGQRMSECEERERKRASFE